VDNSTHAPETTPDKGFSPRGCLRNFLIVGILLFILAGIALGPSPTGIRHWPQHSAEQQAHSLYLALFSYANDHQGQYPDGRSSTEVFQKLIDGEYISDPAVLYLPLPGKIHAVLGQKLKPENVAFDVTVIVDSSSPDEIPIVFETGYKVNYTPSGTAALIEKKVPPTFFGSRVWTYWWSKKDKGLKPQEGIAVAYKNGAAHFMKAEIVTNPDGSIPLPEIYKPDTPIKNFISSTFDSHGRSYRQLTPDGVLP